MDNTSQPADLQEPSSSFEPRPFEVTHYSVMAIAVPMTLAFLTTPLLGLVDTAVVGQLGDDAILGGLAVGAILFDIIFTSLNFFRASTTGLTAQALGEDDGKEQQAVLFRALSVGLVLGLVIAALGGVLLEIGLYFMAPSQAVASATSTYYSIRILAAPFTLGNYVILGWFMGLARSGIGLLLQVVLNGINIIFSILLGLHFGWGIEGVAWATLLGEASALLLGLLLVWRQLDAAERPSKTRVLDTTRLLRLVSVNRDIMIRSFCLLFAFAYFTAQGSKFGDVTLAANAVLMNFFLISGYFLDGFATAAEQLAGRAVGARYRPAFDRTVVLTLQWGFLLALCATIIFFAAGPSLIDLLTTSEASREVARTYLPWAALTALVGVVAFQMDGIFIGATWSVEMRNMMLISLVLYLATWFVFGPIIGNHGLWLALEVFLGARGITMWLKMRTKLEQTFPVP